MLDDLVPIGRFATMTRLSVKALRHYHDLGLLEPARIDPTSNYRYYRLGQANRAEAIRVLRSLDLPLDDVRLILDADRDTARKALADHRDRLDDELRRHERMLEFTRQLLDGEEHVMPYQIELTELPPVTAVSHRAHATLGTVAAVFERGFGLTMGAVGASGAPVTGVPFAVFHDIIDEETSGDVEICVPVPPGTTVASDDVNVVELPAVTVASTVHTGPYMEVSPAYHALATWIREHGHSHAGPPRESYLNDPTQVPEEELLTRIDMPVA